MLAAVPTAAAANEATVAPAWSVEPCDSDVRECALCRRQKRRVELRCGECDLWLCGRHGDEHKEDDHDADFKLEVVADGDITRCTKHPEEVLKYFCQEHNVPVCGHCTTLGEHAQCVGFRRIISLAQSLEQNREPLAADVATVRDNLPHIDQVRQQRHDEGTAMDVRYGELDERVDAAFDTAHRLVDERRAAVHAELLARRRATAAQAQ